MEITLKIFTFLSPFIAAYLIYLLGIKGKKKDLDLQKEKELNVVLSNLLLVWHFLTRIETVIDILNSNNTKSIVPKKYFPTIVLKTGLLNDQCFQDLDNSVDILKKYDPILFFKLEGLGNSLNTIRKRFIMPFLKNPETQPELINVGAGTILNETLNDLEEHLQNVATRINADTLAQIRTFIHNHRNLNKQDMVDEMNERYYELAIQLMPDNVGEKPTLEQFIELVNIEEFKNVFEMPFDLVANGTLEEFLDIVAEKPDISIENAHLELNRRQLK
jgi:hypothetical protein